MLKWIIGDADLADFESLALEVNFANINPDHVCFLEQIHERKIIIDHLQLSYI